MHRRCGIIQQKTIVPLFHVNIVFYSTLSIMIFQELFSVSLKIQHFCRLESMIHMHCKKAFDDPGKFDLHFFF